PQLTNTGNVPVPLTNTELPLEMPVDTTNQQLTDSGAAIDMILPCNENSDFNQQLTNTDSVPVPQSHTDTELPLEMNIIETTSQQLTETASDNVQSDSVLHYRRPRILSHN